MTHSAIPQRLLSNNPKGITAPMDSTRIRSRLTDLTHASEDCKEPIEQSPQLLQQWEAGPRHGFFEAMASMDVRTGEKSSWRTAPLLETTWLWVLKPPSPNQTAYQGMSGGCVRADTKSRDVFGRNNYIRRMRRVTQVLPVLIQV